MKRRNILAALGTAAVAAGFGATAVPAQAAVTSATISGPIVTLNLDGADDNVTVSVAGGLLVHGQTTGGLNSATDWDSTRAGDQQEPADGTISVVVNGGGGNDALSVVAKTSEIATATLNGGDGDDVLTGADTNDLLTGGAGNDRLIGGGGLDSMTGGDGNDTMVWNNGDGSDRMNGEGGNDAVEVNGSPTLGDTFTMTPEPGGVKFQRTNLKAFTLDTASERFQVNGLGGDDSLTTDPGVGAATLLSVDGGAGNDTLNGSDGPDLIVGGEGNDVLSGGAEDDRVVGDHGADTMNGGTGDDTLVWNNGDGTDVVNGDDGRDDVEVNGSPTAGDVSTVQPNNGRIKFDRTNLVPFSLDIGSSETMHANGLGGDDTTTIGDVGAFSVTAAGGSGNDTLNGGPSSDTLLGGSGNDTINPGGGLDVVSGDAGDDQVNVRDNTADIARGGDGNDSVVADDVTLDLLDGFETVDRTPVATPPPPPDTTTRPVVITGGTVKVRNGVAPIRVTCPVGSPVACIGSLELRTANSVKLGPVKAVVELGQSRYDVAAGTSVTVNVRLVSGVRSLADRKGDIKVLATATTGASGKAASSSRHLTLALGAAAKKH